MKPQTKYITVYERSQEYGGAEEGGWYYNWYSVISKAVKIKAKGNKPVRRYKALFDSIFEQQKEFGRYEYEGGVVVRIEDTPYQYASKHRQHYE